MKMCSSIRGVLWQEVQSQTGQNLVAVLVFPQQLEFTYADDVRIVPDLDKEKFPKRQNLCLTVLVQILGRLVEGVGGVMAARGPDELEELAVAGTLPRIHPEQVLGVGRGWQNNGLLLFAILLIRGHVDGFVGGRGWHATTLGCGTSHPRRWVRL